MKIYYRISDNSYIKDKLPGTTKFKCLKNFINIFSNKEVTIIADNCTDETVEKISEFKTKIVRSNEGNAGSFRLAIEKANEECRGDEIVYFVEDDYLHKSESYDILEAGVNSGFSNYYTLYDHPDKYSWEYDYGETSKVVRVNNQHWRFSQSTTMTFACRNYIIQKDKDIWLKHISGIHPNDHLAFTELTQSGRKLAVSIPGHACHVDLTWGITRKQLAIEPWAIELALKNQ